MLTIIKVKAAKPTDKDYKLADGEGLYLLVSKTGNKYWKFRYYWRGKEKKLSLGRYPDVGLAEARDLRYEKRKLLAEGIDPARPVVDPERRFQMVAEEWLSMREKRLAASTCKNTRDRLHYHVFPKMGDRDINDIEPADVLQLIRSIEANGTFEISNTIYGYIGGIYKYAIAVGLAKRNPAADISAAVVPARRDRHFAHLPEKDLPAFLRAIDRFNGGIVTKAAAKFLMMTFVRTDEMRWTTWAEVEHLLEPGANDDLWRIPAKRMKGREYPHIVPLPRQAIELLRVLQPMTGNLKYVFANVDKPSQPISENAVLSLIYSIGYKGRMTGHGIRHIASTVLNEREFNSDAIERQLAHVPKGIRAEYNHAEYLTARREIMQWWADYLDSARDSAKRS